MSLKDRLVLVVDQLCKKTLEKDGGDEGWTAKPEFVNALCVVIEDLCGGPFQEDLTAFAHHAKRKTVGPEDVRLLVRKSPQLVNRLDKFVSDDNDVTAAKRPTKQRKKSSTTTTTTTTNRSNFVETSSSDSNNNSEQNSQSDNNDNDEEEELFKD